MDRRGGSLNRFYRGDHERRSQEKDRRGRSPRPGARGRSRHPESRGQVVERHRSLYSHERRMDRAWHKSPDADTRETSVRSRSDWVENQLGASRGMDTRAEYEGWMRDQGWIRNYGGDWERSSIRRHGFHWEQVGYYDKYGEWEIEEKRRWREKNRERALHMERNWNDRRYEDWYRYSEHRRKRTLSGSHSNVSNSTYSTFGSKTSHTESGGSTNERDRSPMRSRRSSSKMTDRSLKQRYLDEKANVKGPPSVKRSLSCNPSLQDRSPKRSNSSVKNRSSSAENSYSGDKKDESSRRIYHTENYSSTSSEGEKSSSQVGEYNSIPVKKDNKATIRNRTPSNANISSSSESDGFKESSPDDESKISFESSRLRSQVVKLISTERCCRIQRPCDFYQRGTCIFPHWHNDRSNCCRLHVCAFCFYQNYDLIRRGTPVLNLHTQENCSGYMAKLKEKNHRLRTKSLDRCHTTRIRSISPQTVRKRHPAGSEKTSQINKLRCKSLDRRFSNFQNVNKPKLEDEMVNMEVRVFNDKAKGVNLGSKEKILEESTDTDHSESSNITDNDTSHEVESSDDTTISSEESDSSSESESSDDENKRIHLLKAVINSLSDKTKTSDEVKKYKNKDGFKVLVSGLGPEVTEIDIYDLFSTVANLKEANMLGKGKAEVVFKSIDAARAAAEKFDNQSLDGKIIKCVLKKSSKKSMEFITSKSKNTESTSKIKKSVSQQSTPRKKLKSILSGLNERINEDKMKEKNITMEDSNDNMEEEEKVMKVAQNNTTHEETIDLNVSQDLFKPGSSTEHAKDIQLDPIFEEEK